MRSAQRLVLLNLEIQTHMGRILALSGFDHPYLHWLKSWYRFRWIDPGRRLKKEGILDTQQIVRELKAERNRLDRAIAALDGAKSWSTSVTNESSEPHIHTPRKRHHLTAAGRKRLSMLMKKRWAERRMQRKRSKQNP